MQATKEEDKLVLLSALVRIGPCTEEQLLRFVVETALSTQFPFYIALAELKEAELVRLVRRVEGELLVLTPEGRQSIELFGSRIRASLQTKIEQNADAWRTRVRQELQMPTFYVEKGTGYAVTLRVLEAGEEIFSIQLTAATRAQAKRFCERWPRCAPFLYQKIMRSLGETQDDAQ